MRGAVLVVCLVLTGCSGGSLSEADRVAWEKFRNDTCGPGRANVVALQADGWAIFHLGDGRWVKEVPRTGGMFLTHEAEEAPGLAARFASSPENKVVAVIDFCGNSNPQALSWYIDNGKGPKTGTAPPSADVERSLNAFLLQLQKSVGR